jgi:ABC-type Fe3+ transport system permease subunit
MMKEKKPSRQTALGIIVLVVLVGIMYWFKRAGKRKESNSPRIDKQERASDEPNNASSAWWFFYWPFFMVIFTVVLIGAVLYLPTLYPKITSDNLTSAGNFQATVSHNQSLTGTFQIQNPDNQSNTGNNGTVFDLALFSGLLGGFALAVFVARQRQYPKYLQANLSLQGISYVLATVAFIVFGFYLAADRARLLEHLTQLVPVYTISFYIGIISFAFGVSLTLWSLIRLFGKNWKRFWNLVKQAISGD